MAQNKEKLFSPEDFDKNTSSGKGGGKSLKGNGKAKLYAAALAGLLIVGGGAYFISQNGDNPPESGQGTEVVAQNLDQTNGDEPGVKLDENSLGEGQETPVEDSGSASNKDNPATDPSGGTSIAPSTPDQPTPPTPTPTTPSSGETALTPPPALPSGTIEEEALDVIRGKYGNNPHRRQMLGSRYDEIQRKVNEMYRKKQIY